MELRLQVIIGIGSVLVLLYILNMLKREQLDIKYALSWIFADICIMFFCVFPKAIDFIAGVLGVAEPINVIFFLGIIFLGIIALSLTIAQSRNSKKLKDLVQKIALMEKEGK